MDCIKLIKILSVLLFVGFLIFYPIKNPVSSDVKSVEVSSPDEVNSRFQTIFNQINEYRTSQGLNSLQWEDSLEDSARAKGEDMIKFNYWAHWKEDKSELYELISRYNFGVAHGENLAVGFDNDIYVFEAWKDSKLHNQILLGNYDEIGLSEVCFETFSRWEDSCIIILHVTKISYE